MLVVSKKDCIGAMCVILGVFSLSSPIGRLLYELIKVSWINILKRLCKPACNLYIPGASSFSSPFHTNEEHALNGSAGNNQADHYSDRSETQLVKRQKGLSASSDPCYLMLCTLVKLKWTCYNTKRQSRQVSFINHDQIQTQVVGAVREKCTLQITHWTQSLSWLFTKRDYCQEQK